MKDKILTVVISVSMALIGISAVVTTGASFLGIVLPDLVIRLLGIVQLLSLGTMGYSAFRKVQAVKNAGISAVKVPELKGENHES